MDNNIQKLKLYGGLAKEAAARIDGSIHFSLTNDPVEALRDADFIITTLRVGEDEARILDEKLALQYGVLGQETTGAGGFAMASRSIPALVGYMELVRMYAKPGALVFNFTNPSGIVTQALRDEGYSNVYGICDAPSESIKQVAKIIGASADELSFECFGLNHLSWFRSVKRSGREMLGEIIENPLLYSETDEHIFEPALVRMTGMILNEYLYFYYYKEIAVKNILASGVTRGESIAVINRDMTAELSGLNIKKDFDKALGIYLKYHEKRNKSYMSIESEGKRKEERNTFTEFTLSGDDDGGYAGVALNMIESVVTGKRCQMVLSVPNMGAIDGMDDTDIVEITCDISKDGATPVKMGGIPPMQLQLMKQVKLYEKLAVKAIRERSIDTAVKALMVNPLVNSYSIADKLVRDYTTAHSHYCGQWR